MSRITSRTDKAHDISYPSSADARGSTRINHLRRPYYLGPFESPQSYVMFGLWKHRLLETGTAPESRDLRPLVEEFLRQEPAKVSITANPWFIPSLAFSAVCLSAAIIVASIFSSTSKPPMVDNQYLTQSEKEFIRGFRESNNSWQERQSLLISQGDKLADLTLKLKEEGPKKHGRHQAQGEVH